MGIAVALVILAAPVTAGPAIRNHAVEIVSTGVVDPLGAVESNRSALVQRLVSQHREAAFVHGVAESTFHNALIALRSDQLLAAVLVNSFEEVSAIVAQAAGTVITTAAPPIMPKDGPGSGPNSWIGYLGGSNQATGSGSAVAAGTFNLASGQGSFVGAGTANQANGISSLVIGGFDNRATAIDSVVIGGAGHRATGARSFIGGGGYNLASGQWSVIGGGGRDGTASTPAGTNTLDHIAAGNYSFIGGGQGNRTTTGGFHQTIGGGYQNTTSKDRSTVAGGEGNTASGFYSTVAGGQTNTASGNASTVTGGAGNTASGGGSTVAGGENNTASALYSFAAGRRAKATTQGSFIWADSSSFDFGPSVDNFFGARATGGVGFTVSIDGSGAPTQYCNFLPGYTGWACVSDRNAKENMVAIEGQVVLDRLVGMPVYSYNFKGADPKLRMLGPTAQDFHAAFGLGDSDTTIASGNINGVALAAIQGLNAKVEQHAAEHAAALAERDARIARQERELEAQRAELASERAARESHAREVAELRRAVEVLLARESTEKRVAALD